MKCQAIRVHWGGHCTTESVDALWYKLSPWFSQLSHEVYSLSPKRKIFYFCCIFTTPRDFTCFFFNTSFSMP